MSQPGDRDLEGDPGMCYLALDLSPLILPVDGHRNQHRSPPNQPLQSPEEGSDCDSQRDSSWTVYSMYCKIADDEDNKMVEYCQKEADGILIFIGLFSATVGALLTTSIPDLKPNSQDTSAFYLENIYQLQFNTTISHPSTTPALAKPLAFSPPRYAIWVNSLWFLSLTVSLWGATLATLSRNWAVQYISVNLPPRYTPDKRARMRAIFANGNPGPYVIWGTRAETTLLHFSLLLFIAGGLIYLFNINRTVFYAVVWWVGLIIFLYALATLNVFFEPESLFHTPLSPLALRIYLGISYVVIQICSWIPPLHGLRNNIRKHYRDLSDHYSKGILIGKRKETAAIASKPSSEIDGLILERILLTLDEDRDLETFFDAIPNFCTSRLSIDPPVQTKLQQALDRFLDRTFSSGLISESDRTVRLITCLNASHAASGPSAVSGILDNIFNRHWDEALQSVEIGHALRLWGHSRDYDLKIRQIIACIITRVRERDDRWTMLVKETFGVPDRVFRDSLAHGDSVMLSILIHVSRQAITGSWTPGILSSLSNFDIRNTLPGLQHDFCTLWNEIARESRNQRTSSTPAKILCEIRHLYISLHQDTDAAHPLCDIASHHPDSATPTVSDGIPSPTQPDDLPDPSPYQSTLGGSAAEDMTIITGPPSPPDPSTTSEIGETSQPPTAVFPVCSYPPSSDRSPQDGVAMAQPDTTSTATLSHPPETNKQQGPATPHVAPLADTGGIPSTVPTPAPVSASTPPALNKSSATYEASPAFISKSSFPTSSSNFSAPDSPESPPPPHVPPLPDARPFPLLSGMSPKGPSDNATLHRLHPRKLVNNGNMYLANAVLQSLVYCPPFRDLFRDQGRLVGHREGGETGGGATPLIDATVSFLNELAYKEKSSLTQQAARGKMRETEDGKKEGDGVHSFLSLATDIYDTMKEKRQFTVMRDEWQQDAAVFLGLYLEALHEELVTIHSSMSKHKPASTLNVEELEEETQSREGQTEGERDFTASSAESPISRIFGGRSRSTVRAPNRPDTVTVEGWRLLKLNIQPDSVHTVKDALVYISLPQLVQVSQLNTSEASQEVQIEALPSILVLHLERFLYDAAADSIVKISKPIKFAPELEIPLGIMAPDPGKSAEPAHYKLYGVLYHYGESAGSGRYTVNVLHPNGDSGSGEGWLHIDDETVSAVRHDDVSGDYANEWGDDRCAYMLYYGRTASTRT